jgi:hypothetical protein
MIEVPDGIANEYEVVERPENGAEEHKETPSADREFWFTTEVANRFRDTMKVYDRDGAEIRRDLVGK